MASINKNSFEEEMRRMQQEIDRRIMQQQSTPSLGSSITSTTGALSDQLRYPYPEFPITPHTMLYHASVDKAENGYILMVTHKKGQTPQVYIAATTEELQKVFIAAMVAERVSK